MQVHPLYRDPRRRAELQAVLASAFKTLPAKVDAARALGFDWDAVTTPFVELVDDRIVAHVGVLDVPLRLAGRAVRVAGIHAVCTLPSHRRRGCYRRAMEQALAFVDPRWELAQLYTDEPALYEPFGFRVVPTRRWEAARPATATGASAPASTTQLAGISIARPLDPLTELPALVAALSRRTPLSDRYAAMDDGWLLGIDALLSTGDLSLVHRVPELDAFVAGRLEGERFTLCDVITTHLPTWAALAPHLPGRGPVRLAFTPDRFPDAHARTTAPVDDGYYMVRGPFPLDGQDFAVPPLAQH
jgi:GNAT superfamily N-acetyltransferase